MKWIFEQINNIKRFVFMADLFSLQLLKTLLPKTKSTDSFKNFQDVHACVHLPLDKLFLLWYNLNVPNGNYILGVLMRSKNEAVFGEIIEFVNKYFEKNGRSPSTREIEGAIGMSHVTVQRYLQVLRERGEIEYDGHRSVVTQFMREMLDTNRAQMGNSIPCGALDDVIDEEIEHLRLPKAITGEGEFFLLRARGESMIKAGIDNGDLVLIRKQETAKQGNIVAFLYDNEQTTLKRYRQTDDVIYLCPENDAMQPIVIRGEDRAKLRIQGVATGIIKKIE